MSRTRKRRMMNQINVVPYIDVTLVLLVIFMVTAPMTNPGMVELPKVGQALKQSGDPIVVTVLKEGTVTMDGKEMERDDMLALIRQKLSESEKPVVVSADKNTPYGEVVSVMDLLKQAQVNQVGLLFQNEK
ncbi:ExbD/TolR family protein [Methylophilus flavus]|jgi:biopolymer transport protein TolR|uniref:ExbD/TolR family protein n=1 Tax=Methylophilus flavus TaxID=640084 RepID=A0ABW3PEX4_9PROT|nr:MULTISPECIES: ExbD/TolR family protein [unclassified Methylophilus]KQT33242.1 protein TolR [Methylophilus sp. Leaf414]KQT42545.1 protein TolR [Methylophilus sp. Leaf416]KQT56728.1 protein TolR [Methylophilus sp. Leaf459]HSI44657.1 ExbD/TolR family protein [Methylophilus sp.]|eukprot:GILI01034799.1.p2 GENE.GILI01034799.1~~GILI01034799.1.p2  ORF type:complete len:131 (+),score=11.44 GILI01034799.1:122-514(+)